MTRHFTIFTLLAATLVSSSGCEESESADAEHRGPPRSTRDGAVDPSARDSGDPSDSGGLRDAGVLDGSIPDSGFVHGGGPIITILEPITRASIGLGVVHLRVRIEPRAADRPIDRGSVRAMSPSNRYFGALTTRTDPNIYTGAVATVNETPGDFTIRVYAEDQAGNPEFQEVTIVLVEGPRIAVRKPEPYDRVRDELLVDFQVFAFSPSTPLDNVEAMALGDGTPSGGLGRIALTRDAASSSIAATYRGSLDLRFIPGRDEENALTVRATDSADRTTIAFVPFIIDDRGPDIAIQSPRPPKVSGNLITITASVTDGAAVQESSVFAQIAHGGRPIVGRDGNVIEPIPLARVPGTDAYQASFDTRRIPETIMLPSLVVTARDILGNQNAFGLEFPIDNVPPILELDPPQDFRALNTRRACSLSYPFDPVGAEATNEFGAPIVPRSTIDEPDGRGLPAPVGQVFVIHADIEDRGHFQPDARFVRVATIDPATAKLYVLDDTTAPLIVDTDGDAICDDVNPDVVPGINVPPRPDLALELALAPIIPDGSAHYPTGVSCDLIPRPPPILCAPTPMTTAIYYTGGVEPAIWSATPTIPETDYCVGQEVDSGNNIDEGWVCVAAAASDRLGNRGVSPPLRLCICRNGGPCAACSFLPDVSSAPNCTGTALPGRPVSSMPCTPRRFSPEFGSPLSRIYDQSEL